MLLCLSLALPAFADFTDVPTGAYYAEAVKWAVENGYTKGTSDTAFSPDAFLTRGQLATFYWRVKGAQEPKSMESTFLDVNDPDSYYYKAVLWCAENGIVVGIDDDHFAPDDSFVYGQVIIVLWRDQFHEVLYGPDGIEVPRQWAEDEGFFDELPPFEFMGDLCPRCDMIYFLWKLFA